MLLGCHFEKVTRDAVEEAQSLRASLATLRRLKLKSLVRVHEDAATIAGSVFFYFWACVNAYLTVHGCQVLSCHLLTYVGDVSAQWCVKGAL